MADTSLLDEATKKKRKRTRRNRKAVIAVEPDKTTPTKLTSDVSHAESVNINSIFAIEQASMETNYESVNHSLPSFNNILLPKNQINEQVDQNTQGIQIPISMLFSKLNNNYEYENQENNINSIPSYTPQYENNNYLYNENDVIYHQQTDFYNYCSCNGQNSCQFCIYNMNPLNKLEMAAFENFPKLQLTGLSIEHLCGLNLDTLSFYQLSILEEWAFEVN